MKGALRLLFLMPEYCRVVIVVRCKCEVTKLNLGGQIGETNLINESGLYTLTIRSIKEEAKKFKKWVTSDVSPTVRKHGAYMTDNTLEKALMKLISW